MVLQERTALCADWDSGVATRGGPSFGCGMQGYAA